MTPPIKVLLADDHAVVRAGIRQFLEQVDDIQVVMEVSDGRQAEHFIQNTPPDVAVLDIQMPYASGIEVTRWIRSEYPQVGVLILTSYDDDPYVIAVLQAGANGYVLKTATPMEIVQAVRDVHEGKSVLAPLIAQKLIHHVANQNRGATYEALTSREIEVLQLTGKGYTNKAIGVQLEISDRTVQGHLAKIYGKLQVNSRTEAVMRAVSLGLIAPQVDD
ncbi:MAG TPA: response regulator transcription factor [Anaerolineae bacterium]|nr:response regulator transcription factor [Anaerolineae bacterium]